MNTYYLLEAHIWTGGRMALDNVAIPAKVEVKKAKWRKQSIRVFALTTVFLVGFIEIVAARAVRIWPYRELVDKSDFVVLAIPTVTNDTKEHIDLPGFIGEHVIGVEIKFTISAVLKGDKALKDFVLHHYRTTNGSNIPQVNNGPTFISFDPVTDATITPRTFILFLIRESDGRYAPVVGQTDPGGAVRELIESSK